MSRVRLCLGGVLLLSSLAAAQQAPPRDTNPTRTGTARIGGRVTYDDGRPVRRAIITMFSINPQGGSTTSVATDADGRFEFRNIPAGTFTLGARKPPFVPVTITKTIEVANNQDVSGVSFTMMPGGVITGRVVDEFGDPIVSAAVTVLRTQFTQGRRRLSGASRATTNDIGEYRVFGLAAGQYYVAASAQQGAVVMNGTVQSLEDGYAPTYYPGTPDVSAAQRVAVAAGQTMSSIDIGISPIRIARISGVALDSDGRRLPGGGVSAMFRGENTGMNAYSGQLRADGTFTIPNVPPGEYVVRATPPQAPSSPGGIPAVPTGPPVFPTFSMAMVSVNGEDITGVTLAPFAPATVRGRVLFAEQEAAQSIKGSAIRVSALAMNPEQSMTRPGPLPGVKDDFTFEITAPAGPNVLRAGVFPPQSGSNWALTAIRVLGVDVIDTAIDLGPGEVVEDVEVELTNRNPRVAGLVTRSDGNPAGNSYVLLFSQDHDRWNAASGRHIFSTQTGQDGRYKAEALPPGTYYAVAFDHRDAAMEWQDPDFLSSIRDAATLLLSPGDSKTLDLKVR